ncbi:MAE_28990/MAE_18760 family HEPN-like nuclease [Gluconobacter sp. P5B12]|uniref:MAE_28990/MAE_18760 family HEPN-like nuclease n=1 Tax=unclassified Gluconobacter TaxID=2644261 RepID=UPI001C0528DA|nr:MAE_28990/MAE_18760 family HEPN-like nuclease [Gluconobacter sp. P5B12]
MKIRSLDELLQRNAEERVWRIREITFLKRNCVDPKIGRREKEVQRRALIPLAYAHWEGFVKNTGQNYLDFVATQKLCLGDLTPPFQSIYFSVELAGELRKEKRHRVLDLLEMLQSHSGKRVHIKTKGVVSTQDNLNSDALKDICMNLGLDYFKFYDHIGFIDKILLAKRNSIAHGENIFIAEENVNEVCTKVIACIDIFRNLVENAATSYAYKRLSVAE